MFSRIGLNPVRIFWMVFIILAVWLQLFAPGMDFFVPGIILGLQRERFRYVILLLLLAILVQEGTGSLVFGAGILRYGGLVGMFYLGRCLFEGRSPLFILLMASAFTFWQIIVIHTMAGLQSMNILGQRLAWEGLLMFVTFLMGWWILDLGYRFVSRYASQS